MDNNSIALKTTVQFLTMCFDSYTIETFELITEKMNSFVNVSNNTVNVAYDSWCHHDPHPEAGVTVSFKSVWKNFISFLGCVIKYGAKRYFDKRIGTIILVRNAS